MSLSRQNHTTAILSACVSDFTAVVWRVLQGVTRASPAAWEIRIIYECVLYSVRFTQERHFAFPPRVTMRQQF